MNSAFIHELVIAIISTTAAMYAYQWLNWVISRIKTPSGIAMGHIAKAITMSLPIFLNVLRYVLIFGFFASQLHPLLTLPGPPSRTEVGLIAFWVFWSCALFVILMFDLRWWSVEKLIKRA